MRDTVRAETEHPISRRSGFKGLDRCQHKLTLPERLAVEEIVRSHGVVDLSLAQVLLGPKVIRDSHQVVEAAARAGLITIDHEQLLVRWAR